MQHRLQGLSGTELECTLKETLTHKKSGNLKAALLKEKIPNRNVEKKVKGKSWHSQLTYIYPHGL